jgi:hypothetical protein
MSLRRTLERKAKLAKAKLDAFEPPNPSLKPLHTSPVYRPRVLTRRKGYKRDKQTINIELETGDQK